MKSRRFKHELRANWKVTFFIHISFSSSLNMPISGGLERTLSTVFVKGNGWSPRLITVLTWGLDLTETHYELLLRIEPVILVAKWKWFNRLNTKVRSWNSWVLGNLNQHYSHKLTENTKVMIYARKNAQQNRSRFTRCLQVVGTS